jgi:hypothetical protein
MHSIRVKITLITVAAILTTILGVFAACYTTVQAETDRRSVEMMNLIGSAEQEKLEKYFIGVEQSVEMASKIAGDTLDSVFLVENGVSVIGQNGRTAEQQARWDTTSNTTGPVAKRGMPFPKRRATAKRCCCS